MTPVRAKATETYLVPVQPFQVHQNPHQLRNRQRRVGIIELDGHLSGGGEWKSGWIPDQALL